MAGTIVAGATGYTVAEACWGTLLSSAAIRPASFSNKENTGSSFSFYLTCTPCGPCSTATVVGDLGVVGVVAATMQSSLWLIFLQRALIAVIMPSVAWG